MDKKKHPHICPRCHGDGCEHCVAGVIYKRRGRHYASSAGHSAGQVRQGKEGLRNHHDSVADYVPAPIKLYRIGFQDRRLPGEASW